MSLFHRTDLIVTSHSEDPNILNITTISGVDDVKELSLPSEGGVIKAIFVIGQPREGRFVVVRQRSIVVVENVDICLDDSSDDRNKASASIRVIKKDSILDKDEQFHSFRRHGCYLFKNWVVLSFKKEEYCRESSFLMLNITPSAKLTYESSLLDFTLEGVEMMESFAAFSTFLIAILSEETLDVYDLVKREKCFSQSIREKISIRGYYNRYRYKTKYDKFCIFHGNHILFGDYGIGRFDRNADGKFSIAIIKKFEDSEKLGKCSLLFESKDYILVISKENTIVKISSSVEKESEDSDCEIVEPEKDKKKEVESFEILTISSYQTDESVLKTLVLPCSSNGVGIFNDGVLFFPLQHPQALNIGQCVSSIVFVKKPQYMISIKSKRLRDEEMSRMESIFEIIDKCVNSEEDGEVEEDDEVGNPDFWPRKIDSLVYRYTFADDKVIRIPKFFIDSLSFPEEGDKVNVIFNFPDFTINNIDERFIIKFLLLGEDSKTPLTKDQMFELIFFFQKTRLRYHEMYLWYLVPTLSTFDVLSLFEKCIRIYEKKNQVNIEEEEEDLQNFLLNSLDEEKMNVDFRLKFNNIFTSVIFEQLRSVSKEINLNRWYVKFLEKMGHLQNVAILPDSQIQKVKDREDFLPYKHIDFYFLSLSNGYDILVENLKTKMVDDISNSKEYETDVILRLENNSSSSVHLPKLSLILFSNFFHNMFKYRQKMNIIEENINQEVEVEGFPDFEILKYYISNFIFPNLHHLLLMRMNLK